MICCATCQQEYKAEGLRQPNALSCGHSFCHQCIEDLLAKSNPIRCPSCYAYTDRGSIIPNYVIIQIVSGGSQTQNLDSILAAQSTIITCQSCTKNEATIRCYQCQINGFLFCETCWLREHDRDFPPVKQHEKKLISDHVESMAPSVVHCELHPEKVVSYFSFKHNRFACKICAADAEFPKEDYTGIASALSFSHRQVTRRLDLLQQYLLKSQDAMDNISSILASLDMDTGNMAERLRALFSDFEVNMKRRKVQLESMIDSEFSCQKKMLEAQREGIEVSIGHANSKIASAKVLLQKQDLTSLLEGNEMIALVDKLLQEGSATYLKPNTDKTLPFFIDEGFNDLIDKLGVIGGGSIPRNVKCNMISGGLYLQWNLNDEPISSIVEYELEYEAVDRLAEPQSTLIKPAPENCIHHVDGLCPGFSYCFRLRSRNAAGFGIWSLPVIGKMADFPLEIGCSGEITKIQLPHSGLYRITARGAKAADSQIHTGGQGAIISASFQLDAGTILEILAGGMSKLVESNSGGAGGSFVVLAPISGKKELLIAAGGGGGAGGMDQADRNGYDANIDEDGSGGAGADSGPGGVGGNAGRDAITAASICLGRGGAGFLESSPTAFCFNHKGHGGKDGGGFGGGGSVAKQGAGGGGGYSGGGGGRGGGGGGSYVNSDGMDIVKKIGHMSDGSVLIEAVSIVLTHLDSLNSSADSL